MMYTTQKTGTDTSEQKKQMDAEKVEAILKASDEYIGKPIEDDQNITSLEQKYAIAKASILRQLNYSKDDYLNEDVPLFNAEIIELIGVSNKGYINTIKNWVYVDLPGKELKLLQRFDHKSESFLNDVRVIQKPMKWIKAMGLPAILHEIKNSESDSDDMLQIAVSDERLNKIQKWAKRKNNNDKWRLLTGSFYQEKMFIFQLIKLLSSYFGVKVFVKNKILFIKPDEHRTSILERVAISIEQKIFRYKVQRYFFTKKKEWAEVVTDERFAYEYKQITDRYEQNYATGDFDWIIEETGYDHNVATWEDPDYSESATRPDKVEMIDSDIDIDTILEIADVVQMPKPEIVAVDSDWYYQPTELATESTILDNLPIDERLDLVGKQIFYPVQQPLTIIHQLTIKEPCTPT
ncbi:MAG: hypothetical protein ACRDB1_07490 [Microcoleaceae cyanobacterium]